jgi:hypothetical protein
MIYWLTPLSDKSEAENRSLPQKADKVNHVFHKARLKIGSLPQIKSRYLLVVNPYRLVERKSI